MYLNILCAATSEHAPEFKGWVSEASLEAQLEEISRFAEYLGYVTEDREGKGVHFVKKILTQKTFSISHKSSMKNRGYNRPRRFFKAFESISLEDLVMLYNTPHWEWRYIKEHHKNLKNKVREFDKAYFKLHIKRSKKHGFMVSDTKVVLRKWQD